MSRILIVVAMLCTSHVYGQELKQGIIGTKAGELVKLRNALRPAQIEVKVKSNAPARFLANLPKGDLRDIMKFCNHQALTSTVDLEWNLVFTPACQ